MLEYSAENAAYRAQLENAMRQGVSGQPQRPIFPSPTTADEEEAAGSPPRRHLARRTVDAVGRGVGRAANELSNTAFSVAKWGYKTSNLYKLGRDGEEEAEFLEWYERKTQETNPFQVKLAEREEGVLGFLETAVQFGVGLAGIGKFTKPLQIASRATSAAKAVGVAKSAQAVGTAAQGASVGFLTDMAAFDPYEQRLSDMIENGPDFIRNPITGYLASQEEDTELERRVKAGLEGLMTGAAVAGVMGGIRAMRISRLWKSGAIKEQEAVERINRAFAEEAGKVGDEVAQVVELEKGRYAVQMKGQEGGLEFDDLARAESTAASINTAAKVAELPTDRLTEEQTQSIFEIHKRILENPDGMDVENLIEGISINFPRWQAPEEVKALVNAMIEAVPEPGKTMRNRSLEGLGKSIPEVYEGALKRTFVAAKDPSEARAMAEEFFGSTENLDEKVVALYDYLAARGAEVLNLSKVADITPDNPQAMANLVEATEDYLRVLWHVNAGSSNIGRALNAHKYRTAGELADAVKRASSEAVEPDDAKLLSEFLSGFTKGDLVDMARQLRLSDGNPEGIVNAMRGMRAKVANRSNPDPKTWEKVLGFRTESMLSGPTTQLVNTIDNALVAVQVPAEKWWAGVRSGNASLRQEGWDHMAGLFMYVKDAARAAKKAWQIGDNVLDPSYKVDEFRIEGFPGAGFLHTLSRAPSRFLLTADEFMKQLTYRADVRARSIRLAQDAAETMGLSGKEYNTFIAERVARDLKAAFDLDGRGLNSRALQMARYTTHTESLDYGIGKWIQEGAAKYPLMRVVFPFVRTPVQIFRFTWERTPVLNKWNRRHAQMLAAGGEQAAIAKARADAGMMMYSMGALMVANGTITGSGPKDGRMREQWLNAGNQPYSLRIGGKQISYRRMEPIATPLALVADFIQAVGDLNEDDATQMVSASVAALMSSVASKTFLMGMTEFFDAAASGDSWKVDRMVNSLATSFMPNALRQVNPDDTYREARSLLDEIMARTPGWSDSLEPRRNIFGEPVLMAPGYFNRRMNPFVVMDAPDDEVLNALVDLGESIAMPGETLEGGAINLADVRKYDNGTGQSPYDRLLELMGDRKAMGGKNLRDRMEALVKSSRWETMSVGTDEFPGGQRLDAARDLVNNYRARAMKQLRREYPLLDEAIKAARREKIAAMRGTPRTSDVFAAM